MKETVAAFERRTGRAYAPPEALCRLGRRLRQDEPCPTLFRYPGPEALADFLRGRLRRLAPASAPWVWLATRAIGSARAARRFGAIAVLEPLRLQPVVVRRGQLLARNLWLGDPEDSVWVPPSVVSKPIAWDRIRRASEAIRRMKDLHPKELSIVSENLNHYLNELSALRRAGVPGSERPWCDIARNERRRILAAAGIEGPWTR